MIMTTIPVPVDFDMSNIRGQISTMYEEHMDFTTGCHGMEDEKRMTCQKLNVYGSLISYIRHSIHISAPGIHVFNMVNSLYYTSAIDVDAYMVNRECTIDVDEYDWCQVVKTRNRRASFLSSGSKREYTKMDISSRKDMSIVTRSVYFPPVPLSFGVIPGGISSVIRVFPVDNNNCKLVHVIWMDIGGYKTSRQKNKILHTRGKNVVLNISELVSRSMSNGPIIPKGNPLYNNVWERDPYMQIPGLSSIVF